MNNSSTIHAMNDDQSHKYRWVSYLDRMTNGDITKTDEVLERNYLETLNLLSYWKIRDEQIALQNKLNK